MQQKLNAPAKIILCPWFPIGALGKFNMLRLANDLINNSYATVTTAYHLTYVVILMELHDGHN